ncbi:tetratricopeptide repeat protein [Roseivirga sp.]|uniref:tetratricopeptide repeat protein n=1 Tax=Roseivirga sp. TaxID=1964215 RepID=UPI003B8C9512
MKKIKFFVLALGLMLGSVSVMAQDSTYLSNEYAKALALFDKSQKYNDALLTKQALFEILVLNPNDSSAMRSLSELYYNSQQYTSSALVSLDMLERYPNNEIALEIVALSYENLRLYDRAVEYYEKLWLKTENTNVQYQIAYLQYSLRRFTESETNLGMIESKVTAEDKISLNKSDGTIQEIPFAAAIANLRGLMAVEQGNNEEAKAQFTKAISISPDFDAAKNSLAGLNK